MAVATKAYLIDWGTVVDYDFFITQEQYDRWQRLGVVEQITADMIGRGNLVLYFSARTVIENEVVYFYRNKII